MMEILRFGANDSLEKAIAERPASLATETIRQYIRLNAKIDLIYLLSCIACVFRSVLME